MSDGPLGAPPSFAAPSSPPSPGAASPPPTPFERRRRRRRLVVVALVVLGALGLATTLLVTGVGGIAAPPAGEEVPEPGGPEGPEARRAPTPLDRPELDDLAGADLALARVLIAIDDAELVMLTYDDELTEAFGPVEGAAPDLDGVLERVAAAAARGEAALVLVADELATGEGESGAEAVRAAYAPHLEAWRALMARVARSPDVLLIDGATEADTAEINVTADVFRRALEEVLEGAVDTEVAAFAEAILDRGFRGYERDAAVSSPAPPPRDAARSAASSATSARTRSSS